MLGVSLAIAILFVSNAQGHDEVILKCSRNIPIKEVFLIETGVLGNGLYSEMYSKTEGGPPYIEALSIVTNQYPGTDHDTYPLFYIVDLDEDGVADITYQDIAPHEATLEEHCASVIIIDSKVIRNWKDT